MKVYGIRNCDTVRAAMRALQAAGFAPELVDIRATPLEAGRLAALVEAFGPALVNMRSATWRGLSPAEREADPAALLAAHPTLMKRPVIEDGTRLTLGWDGAVQEIWLGNSG